MRRGRCRSRPACYGQIGSGEGFLTGLAMPERGLEHGCLQKDGGWLQMSWSHQVDDGSCFLNVLVDESQNEVDST
jgi:hypothetical protein